MAGNQKKKTFLNKPKYAGGNDAFRQFITDNLHYPQAALEANVEGSVVIEYDIHDTGLVKNMKVLKGLGHGCDEEALRVIRLLRFESVKNRGLRLKITTKTTINFKLPGGVRITYSPAEKMEPAETEKEKPVVYGYTIQL